MDKVQEAGLAKTYLRTDVDNEFSGDLKSSARNKSVIGDYDPLKTDQIWAMSSAYSNAADGSDFGTLYGLAYKYIDNPTGGEMAGRHQVVWCNLGSPRAAMGYDGLWGMAVYDGDGTDRKRVYSPNNPPPSMGIGQTYKSKTGSYLSGVQYRNTGDKPIFLSARCSGTKAQLVLQVDGVTVDASTAIHTSGTQRVTVGAPVPANSTFRLTVTHGTLDVVELS